MGQVIQLPISRLRLPSNRATRYPALGLIVLVSLLTAIATWHHSSPIVYEDEPGYLGNARWLIGGPVWHMGTAVSYQVGYSLLLAPVFLFLHNPGDIYRGAILVNCILCGVLAGILYLLARCMTGSSQAVAVAAGAVGSAYPAVTLQAGIAWPETATMLGFAVFVLTTWWLFRSPRSSTMFANVLIVVFLSSVHNRFLLLPFVCAVLFVVLALSRADLRKQAIASLVLLAVTWLGGRELQEAVHRARWDPGAATTGASVHLVVQAIPTDLLRTFSGGLWYLLVGTAGLALVGLVACGSCFLRYRLDDFTSPARPTLSPKLMLAYTLAAIASLFIIAEAFVATGFASGSVVRRFDYLAYGRYIDPLTPTLVALAVTSCWSAPPATAHEDFLSGPGSSLWAAVLS